MYQISTKNPVIRTVVIHDRHPLGAGRDADAILQSLGTAIAPGRPLNVHRRAERRLTRRALRFFTERIKR